MKKYAHVFFWVTILLVCCKKEAKECSGSVDKIFDLSGFNKIYVGESFSIDVQKGNTYSIKASGCADDIANVEMKVTDNILDVSFRKNRKNKDKVFIIVTLPQVHSLNLSGNAQGRISGFSEQSQTLRTFISGNSTCVIEDAPPMINFDITGNSSLLVKGSSVSLWGTLSGNCQLNAYDLLAREVDISAIGNSTARVKVWEEFYASASGNSKIYYKGNPPTTHLQTNHNGEIIHE